MFFIKGRFALTRDPEMKTTPSGKAVTNGGAADNYKDKVTGEQITTWLDLVAWEDVANELATFTKGQIVELEGWFQRKPWKDKQGNMRDSFQVTVVSIKKYTKASPEPRAQQAPQEQKAQQAPQFVDLPDEDLPF